MDNSLKLLIQIMMLKSILKFFIFSKILFNLERIKIEISIVVKV